MNERSPKVTPERKNEERITLNEPAEWIRGEQWRVESEEGLHVLFEAVEVEETKIGGGSYHRHHHNSSQ